MHRRFHGVCFIVVCSSSVRCLVPRTNCASWLWNFLAIFIYVFVPTRLLSRSLFWTAPFTLINIFWHHHHLICFNRQQSIYNYHDCNCKLNFHITRKHELCLNYLFVSLQSYTVSNPWSIRYKLEFDTCIWYARSETQQQHLRLFNVLAFFWYTTLSNAGSLAECHDYVRITGKSYKEWTMSEALSPLRTCNLVGNAMPRFISYTVLLLKHTKFPLNNQTPYLFSIPVIKAEQFLKLDDEWLTV